jgi:hypothetical protein
MADVYDSLERLGPGHVKHRAGWEVLCRDRHRVEYRDGVDVAYVEVEDLAAGVVLYARTLEWRADEHASILARCALALEALGWGPVQVDWDAPAWGRTGVDEAFSFDTRCRVRLDRSRAIVIYEAHDGRVEIQLQRTTMTGVSGAQGRHSAWLLHRAADVPGAVTDAVVEAILFLTGEPVQVAPPDETTGG